MFYFPARLCIAEFWGGVFMSSRSVAEEEVHYCDDEPTIEYRDDRMCHVTYHIGTKRHRYVMPIGTYRKSLKRANRISDQIGEHRVVPLQIQR
jgi:hypothetical protein